MSLKQSCMDDLLALTRHARLTIGFFMTMLFMLGADNVLMAAVPLHAESPAEVSERESLKGIGGMEVLVEPLNVELETLGLEALAIQNTIRHHLQKAGINVLTEHERLATQTAAVLAVRVDALHDRIGRYFYCIDLLFTQRVRLKGKGTPDASAVTWMKPGGIGLIADDKVKQIEGQILHKVDQFIKDYLAANLDLKKS
ncbi:MAG TPA: hypothetical protein VIU63_02600 [Nitrospira sp.]